MELVKVVVVLDIATTSQILSLGLNLGCTLREATSVPYTIVPRTQHINTPKIYIYIGLILIWKGKTQGARSRANIPTRLSQNGSIYPCSSRIAHHSRGVPTTMTIIIQYFLHCFKPTPASPMHVRCEGKE